MTATSSCRAETWDDVPLTPGRLAFVTAATTSMVARGLVAQAIIDAAEATPDPVERLQLVKRVLVTLDQRHVVPPIGHPLRPVWEASLASAREHLRRSSMLRSTADERREELPPNDVRTAWRVVRLAVRELWRAVLASRPFREVLAYVVLRRTR